ncbi:DUF3850 domain-containing protein [Pectobacterium brasiliense]|uniref:DUF3850 domain-containing protein n=1 Tax=Pectobacterium brasiliense TaxID=180957 RepID=UPI00057DDAB9|nr:DUF3850 domain-containing protein [Pectobacterium brasiliense]KHS87093.1 hypothetical protein RC83_13295 [Pectobacterium brasiliense]
MSEHQLKIHPQHFHPVLTNAKRAELRKNDRDYKEGDVLLLKEFNPISGSFTGNQVNRLVTHVADVSDYLPGYVLISLGRYKKP